MIRIKLEACLPWIIFLVVLFISSPWCHAADGAAGFIQVEKNGAGHYIRVGENVTYRRYLDYFTTTSGLATLLSALAQTVMTGPVIYQSAREISGFFSTPASKRTVFTAVLVFMPLAIRSMASWYMQKRLITEQIVIDSRKLRSQFYIELVYDPLESGQVLRILPLPVGIADIKRPGDKREIASSLRLWNSFYETLQKKKYVAVELSWEFLPNESDGTLRILVNIITEEGEKKSRSIVVDTGCFESDNLPDSLESLLHNEWSPDQQLQSRSMKQLTITLLKDEVIQAVVVLAAAEAQYDTRLSFDQLLTQIDFRAYGSPHEAILCNSGDRECGTSLQLLWQPAPYPHYRPVLSFVDSEHHRKDNGIIQSALVQLRDLNLAEQLMNLFEQTLLSTVYGLIYHRQVNDNAPGAKGSSALTTVHAMLEKQPSRINEDLALLSTKEWGNVLNTVHYWGDKASLDAAFLWMTEKGYNWKNLFRHFIQNKKRKAFQQLASRPEEDIQIHLIESLIEFLEADNGETWETLLSNFPVQGDVIKRAVTRIISDTPPASRIFTSLTELSITLLKSPQYNTKILVEMVIEQAKGGFVDAIKSLVTDQEIVFLAMEKALELKDPELNANLARANLGLCLAYLKKRWPDNQPEAMEWFKSLPSGMQQELIRNSLKGNLKAASFVLEIAGVLTVAQRVFEYLKEGNDHTEFQSVSVNNEVMTLKLIVENQSAQCLPIVFKWLSARSQEEIQNEWGQLGLSDAQLGWLVQASVQRVNAEEINADRVSAVLAGIASNLSHESFETLLQPMPVQISTAFMINLGKLLKKTPFYFVKAVEAMSESQAGHYLATLTNSDSLWKEEELNAYLVTQKKTPELHVITQYNPNERRYETIKGWYDDMIKNREPIKKLQDDLSCSICESVYKDPAVIKSCGHTFCHTCITEWFERSRAADNPATCPLCRKEILGESPFTRNQVLKSLIENRQLQTD